jgi:RNA-directed DNA polymerase
MTAGAQQAGAVSHNHVDWDAINWHQVNDNVRRLQARIVKATKAGRYNKVKALQRLLTHSFSGRCLAVKRVTTNKGRNTPGVDGRIWKSQVQKAVAVDELRAHRYKPRPLKRVYIPKGDGRRRGLNIPAMKDRAMQALYLLALDPIAETTADANSYGFRLGRSPADAIAQCFKALSRQSSAQWILEADIRACFDTISHEWLLTNIPLEKKILRKWLEAGFIEEGHYHPTEIGAPQGGIISPVLMNLTLNGLERVLSQRSDLQRRTSTGKRMKVNLVRFADDFIVTAGSKELLETEVKPLIEGFLKVRGLELSPEKTCITHIGEGFDFLGQHLRKNRQGKLLIRPSAKSLRRLLRKVREITRKHQHVSPGVLIWMLNPILKGWAAYHRHVASKQTFAKADQAIFEAVWRWCRRRHRRKSRRWVKQRYFCQIGSRDWVFSGKLSVTDKRRPIRLYCLAQTPIRRHTKIRGEANAYDPEWEEYFERRLDEQTKESLKGLKLLLYLWQQQKGLCLVCQQKITKRTGWRTHHLTWRAHGGSDRADNLVLLHPDCHQQVHRRQLVVMKPRSTKSVGKA